MSIADIVARQRAYFESGPPGARISVWALEKLHRP